MSPGPRACTQVAETFDRHPFTVARSRSRFPEPPFSSGPRGDTSVHAFLLSFGVIFLAELGDKSQLMALAFAARFPVAPVLVAITIATAVVHLGSVALGATVALAVPTNVISIVAGAAFLVFAAWTLRGDVLEEANEARTRRGTTRSVILTVGVAFFLAELGDKTMLATV